MVKEKKKITPIDYVKENFFTDTLWLSGLKSAHFFIKLILSSIFESSLDTLQSKCANFHCQVYILKKDSGTITKI